MAQFQYDATNVPVRQSRDVMPSQWYLAAITESEIGAGRNPGSTIVKVEYTIQAPPEFRGRKVFDNINAKNANPEAERIGNETISSISHAVGKIRINDTNEWHGVPLAIKLGIEPPTLDENGNEKYPAKNKVNDIKPATHYKGDVGAPAGLPNQAQFPTFAPSTGFANAAAQAPAAAGWPPVPAAAPVAPPAPVQAAPQVSPDGKWVLVNNQWVANVPPPAPAPAVAAPPATPWPGAAGAPPAAGPWAQG